MGHGAPPELFVRSGRACGRGRKAPEIFTTAPSWQERRPDATARHDDHAIVVITMQCARLAESAAALQRKF
jgi:hypothetical protein